MSTTVAVVLLLAVTAVRGVRRRRLRRRVLGSGRRRSDPRRAAARGDRPLDRPGVGGQPRVADLLLRRAVDGLPRGVRLDHADPVRPADDRRPRDRAARIELRVPQDRVPHPRPPQLRRRLRRCRRCSCRSAWVRSPVPSPPAACRRGARPGIRGRAGSTRRRCSVVCSPSSSSPTWPSVYLVWDARRLGGRHHGRVLPPARRRRRRHRRGGGRHRDLRPAVGCPLPVRRVGRQGASGGPRLRRVWHRLARPARAQRRALGPRTRHRRGGHRRRRMGRGPVALHTPGEPEVSEAAAPSGTLATLLVAALGLLVIVVPGFILLYVLDQRSLLPEEGVD